VKVINKTKNIVLAENASLADTALSRLVGLLGRSAIAPSEALIITHCRSIHMLFMKFPLDVIFVDKNNKVVGLVCNILPFRFSPYFFRAVAAIEIFPGTIARTQIQMKDEICFEE